VNAPPRRSFIRDNSLSIAPSEGFSCSLWRARRGGACAATTTRPELPACRRLASGDTSAPRASPSTSPRTGSRSSSSSACTSPARCGWCSAARRSPNDRAPRVAKATRNRWSVSTPGRTLPRGRASAVGAPASTPTRCCSSRWSCSSSAGSRKRSRVGWPRTRSGCATSLTRWGWGSTSRRRTSGGALSRTGSRSSSPSGRWRSSRSTSGSAARPRARRSGRRTTPRCGQRRRLVHLSEPRA
jgi:hypothetical protein